MLGILVGELDADVIVVGETDFSCSRYNHSIRDKSDSIHHVNKQQIHSSDAHSVTLIHCIHALVGLAVCIPTRR